MSSGSTSATYAYNGDGLRTSKTVNGASEGFTWDLGEGMPLILQDGSTKYITGPGGLPIEQVDGSGTVLYYYQDQLGIPRGLRDASGNAAASYTYDAYGNQVAFSSNGATTPFRFAAQYTDAESGLQYLRNRYCDPSTAQFMMVDPLAGVTMDPYAYRADDPVNGTDPVGLCGAGAGREPEI